MSVISKNIKALMKPQEVLLSHRPYIDLEKQQTEGNNLPLKIGLVYQMEKGLPEDLNLNPMPIQKLSGIKEPTDAKSITGNTGSLTDFSTGGKIRYPCGSD